MHGDLHPLNLLLTDAGDRLVSVIDFGDLTAGDPAVDLATAWLTFGREARRTFAREVTIAGAPVDAATWGRARGWAVSIASALATSDGDDDRAVASRAIDALVDDGPLGD